MRGFLILLPLCFICGELFRLNLKREFSHNRFGVFLYSYSLSFPVVIALQSIVLFFSLLISPGFWGAPLADIIVSLSLITALLFTKWNHKSTALTARNPLLLVDLLLWGAFFFLLLVSVRVFFDSSSVYPHGLWDAWAMWNTKAKFIFLGGAEWLSFNDNHHKWLHPDYPLLLPFSVARVWMYASRETLIGPIYLALGFYLSLIGIVVGTLLLLSGRRAAAVAGCALLSTPFLAGIASSQYADIPLATYYAASGSLLLLLANSKRSDRFLPFLLGLCTFASLWTKNDAAPFVIVISALLLVSAPRSGARRELIASYILGALPSVMAVALLKIIITSESDLLVGESLMIRVLDYSRWREIWNGWVGFALSPIFSWVPVALLALLLSRTPFRGGRRPLALVTLVCLTAMVLSYSVIYLITPHDLSWHLSHSMERLVAHLYPLAVIALSLFFDIDDDSYERASMDR